MESRKELQERLLQIQKDYAEVNGKLKELNAKALLERKKEAFKEYTLKVYVSDAVEDKALAVEEDDYPVMEKSSLGFPIVRHETGGTFILLKSEDEIPRYKTLVNRFVAAKKLSEVQDKKREATQQELEQLHKTLLGEEDPLPPMVD